MPSSFTYIPAFDILPHNYPAPLIITIMHKEAQRPDVVGREVFLVEVDHKPYRYSRAIHEKKSPFTTRAELGSKGANIVAMAELGLPVPPGYVLTTDAWRQFRVTKDDLSTPVLSEIIRQTKELEKTTERNFGDPDKPLFVSARSGSPVSLPGAMTTILNIGINDETVKGLSKEIGETEAWHAYFTLIRHMGIHAYNIPRPVFDDLKTSYYQSHNVQHIEQLPADNIKELVSQAKDVIATQTGEVFPQNPWVQLRMAVTAVFRSWDTQEAEAVRSKQYVPFDIGTAAVVQQMIWGNDPRPTAGSGVMYTRNRQTLEDEPVVAFAHHDQGTAVVSDKASQSDKQISELPITLQAQKQLRSAAQKLEKARKRPQEVEFTIDGDGHVWFLQTRSAYLSTIAWFRYLQESIVKRSIKKDEAMTQITPVQLRSLLMPSLDQYELDKARQEGRLLTRGITVSIGSSQGIQVSSIEEARTHSEENVILCIPTLHLTDIASIPHNVKGIVTGNGGVGSHLAIHASALDIPVLFSADIHRIHSLPKETTLTLNATDGIGEILKGQIPTLENGNKRITGREQAIVHTWLMERTHNPWKFVSEKNGTIRLFSDHIRHEHKKALRTWKSPRAHEVEVLNATIPNAIRMDYRIIKPDQTVKLLRYARSAIKTNRDTTIRTCHTPPKRGSAPWARLATIGDVTSFFDPKNPKGYRAWTKDPELTEITMGLVPKDKMNLADQTIQHQHCAWTLSCTENGNIMLQIIPHTAYLRTFELEHADNLVTITARVKREPGNGKNTVELTDVVVGNNINNDVTALALSNYVAQTIFGDWWFTHKLPQRLAAVANMFPADQYATPVLEGQARINPENQSRWCLVYDMKLDMLE